MGATGEKVLRLIRTDRLRVEAFVELKFLPPQPENLSVRWIMPFPEEKSQSYSAKITFVSAEANPSMGKCASGPRSTTQPAHFARGKSGGWRS